MNRRPPWRYGSAPAPLTCPQYLPDPGVPAGARLVPHGGTPVPHGGGTPLPTPAHHPTFRAIRERRSPR